MSWFSYFHTLGGQDLQDKLYFSTTPLLLMSLAHYSLGSDLFIFCSMIQSFVCVRKIIPAPQLLLRLLHLLLQWVAAIKNPEISVDSQFLKPVSYQIRSPVSVS